MYYKNFSDLFTKPFPIEPKAVKPGVYKNSNQITPSHSEFRNIRHRPSIELNSEQQASVFGMKKNGNDSPSLISILQSRQLRNMNSQNHLEELSLVSNKESFDFRDPIKLNGRKIGTGVKLNGVIPTMFRSEDELPQKGDIGDDACEGHCQDVNFQKHLQGSGKNFPSSNRSIMKMQRQSYNGVRTDFTKRSKMQKLKYFFDDSRHCENPQKRQFEMEAKEVKNLEFKHLMDFESFRKKDFQNDGELSFRKIDYEDQNDLKNPNDSFSRKLQNKNLFLNLKDEQKVNIFIPDNHMILNDENRYNRNAKKTKRIKKKDEKILRLNSRYSEDSQEKKTQIKNLKLKKKSKFEKRIQKSGFWRENKEKKQNTSGIEHLLSSNKSKPIEYQATQDQPNPKLKNFQSKLTNIFESKSICSKSKKIDLCTSGKSIFDFISTMITFCNITIDYIKQQPNQIISLNQLLFLMEWHFSASFLNEFKVNCSTFMSFYENSSEFLTIEAATSAKKFYELSLKISQFNLKSQRFLIRESTGEVFAELGSCEDAEDIGDAEVNQEGLMKLEEYIQKYQNSLKASKPENTNSIKKAKDKMYSPTQFTKIPSSKSCSNKSLCSSKKLKKITKKRNKKKGCNCSKSKCLRLHCVCFRDGAFCGDDCGCKGCFNTIQNKELVMKVRASTKDINSSAFESRIIKLKIGNKTHRFTYGCSCSKNNCLKNYCECKKNGLPCSPLCRCEGCQNCRVHLDPSLANSLHRKVSRKKKKIIFKEKNKDSIEVVEKVLASKFKKK